MREAAHGGPREPVPCCGLRGTRRPVPSFPSALRLPTALWQDAAALQSNACRLCRATLHHPLQTKLQGPKPIQ